MTYTVTPNDSIGSIAETFQVPVSELMSMNGLGPNSRLIPGMVIIIPPVSPRPPRPPFQPTPPMNRIYIVRRGDTIWSISRRFGVSVNDIMFVNQMTFPVVFPGQRLIIPSRMRPFPY